MSPRKKIGHRAGKSDHKTYCCVVYGVTKDITRKLLCDFFFVIQDFLPDFTQYTVVTYHSYSIIYMEELHETEINMSIEFDRI